MRWLLAVMLLLACKGDPEKCDQACRNYAQLVFWDKANAEIQKVPVGERDALRRQKMAELAKNLAEGVDMCQSKCMSANNEKDTNCLIKAKTAEEARGCVTK